MSGIFQEREYVRERERERDTKREREESRGDIRVSVRSNFLLLFGTPFLDPLGRLLIGLLEVDCIYVFPRVGYSLVDHSCPM